MSEYDWRHDIALVEQTWGGRADDGMTAVDRLEAHITRLTAQVEALRAEHEAVLAYRTALRDSACKTQRRKMLAAHDRAEEVLRDE